jgi:hypothetical protein
MAGNSVSIGKIVRSDSHVRYTCQIFGPGEIAQPPEPTDFAFGTFVRVPLRVGHSQPDLAPLPTAPEATARSLFSLPTADVLDPRDGAERSWAVGLIYDTILVNPDFGTLGPRLSSDTQIELFSPDYLSERAVLVSILLLGTVWEHPSGTARVRHGVPLVAPDLSAVVTGMDDAEVRAFHLFADQRGPADTCPYLHMGYLPHAIAQVNPLMPLAMLHTIERLESLCPENTALLSIVKRNFAWRLKVETAG